jgi:hypothetical protein
VVVIHFQLKVCRFANFTRCSTLEKYTNNRMNSISNPRIVNNSIILSMLLLCQYPVFSHSSSFSNASHRICYVFCFTVYGHLEKRVGILGSPVIYIQRVFTKNRYAHFLACYSRFNRIFFLCIVRLTGHFNKE